MDFLSQLMNNLQGKPQQKPQLMQVNRNGSHGPSTQGNLPPAQQKDTWLSNDPAAMRPPANRVPSLYGSPAGNIDSWSSNDPSAMYPPIGRQVPSLYSSPSGNQDSWNINDPSALYPPTDPRSRLPQQGNYPSQQTDPLAQLRHFLGL